MVTIRDVAAAAGVSPMSVSNALSGTRPVSEVTRVKVMSAVERLGYQVNTAARSLRQGRTGVVGVVVPTLESQYYAQLCGRLVRRFAEAGLSAVVEDTGATWERQASVFRDSRVAAYDGLVLSPIGLSEAELRSFAGRLPLVVLGEQQLHRSVDRVGMANAAGAAAATRVLLARGCRRLAVVGAPPLDQLGERAETSLTEGAAFVERARGFLAATREVPGVTTTSLYTGSTLADGRRAGHDLLAAHPDVDGVLCATDTLAFGVLRALADRGVRVPDDVRVIGFDDVEEASFSVPSLSSVDPGHEAMAAAAVELLVRRITDPGAAPRDVVGEARVVERQSTA
ncbi:LacI family DNA-binding transcriptional regulator [Quadrisphaera setariae]|uniref:LacI family transcriptional regulator n=1 Tax=Quadrisphaera setariae TaxID=2593304 RepID=A0A5C8ZJ68_9ACTN|nr:LacI family DNA-binding transcriptional regulator [Quadrisphaera setariae]TXR56966.1 LacI family transcriptional regulator [Quadrisphaera setariae]